MLNKFVKKYLRRLCPVVVFMVFMSPVTPCAPLHAQEEQSLSPEVKTFRGESEFTFEPLYDQGRFPNVLVSKAGTVIATFGHQTVSCRRSTDGGRTWGPVILIHENGIHGGGTTVDETTGDLLVFAEDEHPPAMAHCYRSRDDGLTWVEQDFRLEPDRFGNIPSMHMNEKGLTLQVGDHRGRLIRPTRHYAAANDRKYWPEHYTNAIYSDDGGRSWKTSDPFPENGTGEAAIVELADGRLLYNSRVHWDARPDHLRRRQAISHDGGQTWTDFRVVDALPDGTQDRSYGLMGGLTRLPLKNRDVVLFSNVDTEGSKRERGTIWASFDGGETWPIKRLVFAGRSAYSSLASGRPGTPSEGWIYLHIEEGENSVASNVARFNLSWILEGDLTGDGAIPSWLKQ